MTDRIARRMAAAIVREMEGLGAANAAPGPPRGPAHDDATPGTHIHLDYPPSADGSPRWTRAVGHGQLKELLEPSVGRLEAVGAPWRSACDAAADVAETLPDDDPRPRWRNPMFAGLDALSLGLFLSARPALYLEIGSGHSTRFARHFVNRFGSSTRIVSIDPRPRAECDALCDEIRRESVELVDVAAFEALSPGDVLFFDGSHRSFMNSDVTAVFLDVLPRLAPGVIVGVHDIFLPDDYPGEWADRYYNEQYVLSAYLLGAAERIEVLFPAYHLCVYAPEHPIFGEALKRSGCPADRLEGCAFWFTHRVIPALASPRPFR